jgi:hypothetical protein
MFAAYRHRRVEVFVKPNVAKVFIVMLSRIAWLGLVAGIVGWICPRMQDKITEEPVGKVLGLQLKNRRNKFI